MKILVRIAASVLIIFFLTVGLSYGQSAAMQHLTKGVDYAAQGEFEEAKKEFRKVSKSDPLYQSIEESLKVVEDAIDKKIPSKLAIHLFRGAAYVIKGRLDEAIAEYNKAVEMNPRFALAYRFRGFAYARKGQYDLAISDYNKAIEINPRLASAYARRGSAYLYKGQYDQAISDYNKAIEINPSFAMAYVNRGIAHNQKGQFNQGISDCTRAIELTPKLAMAHINRGVAYYHQGEYDKAWEDVHKAESLGHQVDPEFLKDLREASGRQE